MKRIIQFSEFAFFSLAFFFPLGLLFLTVGPTRWFANYAKKNNLNQNIENIGQISIILFLIITSCYVGFLLKKKYSNSSEIKKKKYALVSILILLLSVGIFTLKPEYLVVGKLNLEATQNKETLFEFGSYPDEVKIISLKERGYTAIISLLHPLIVPAEPIMLNKEKNIAKKHNIKIVSFPLMPWISKNEESIENIKKFAKTAKGKYYVHCSLGRDRAGIFKKIIEIENAKIKIESGIKHNLISESKPFERGPVFKISNNEYFTPYPTDEELFHYFLNSNIKTVVNLMNNNDLGQLKWIQKEKEIIELHHQKFYNFSIESKTNAELKKIIQNIKKLPRPIVMHVFSTNKESAKQFLDLYKANK